MAEDSVKVVDRVRDVQYDMAVADDLPDSIAVERRSPINDNVDKVRETGAVHGKWVRIGSYKNGTAASAAANVLRRKHGDTADVEGFLFAVKRIVVGDDEEHRTGLFIKYDPKAVVDGGRASFDARMKTKDAQLAAKRAEKAKANGKK